MFVLDVLVFVFCFLVCGIILTGVYLTLAGQLKTDVDIGVALLFCFGLAPALTSLAVCAMFVCLPGKPASIYVLVIVFAWAACFVLGLPGLRLLLLRTHAFLKWELQRIRGGLEKDKAVLGLALVFIFSYIFFQSALYPIVSHDGCVYEVFGRIFAQNRSLKNYPMSAPDKASGFYSTIKHPPGLPLLYSSMSLIRNERDCLASRVVSATYSFYLAILLFWILRCRAGTCQALFGTLLLMLVPAFVWQSIENSIDPPRMFFFLCGVYFASEFVGTFKPFHLASALLALFFCLYFHLTGVLVAIVVFSLLAVESLVANRGRLLGIFPKLLTRHALVSAGVVGLALLMTAGLVTTLLAQGGSRHLNYFKKIFSLDVSYDKGDLEFRGISVEEEPRKNITLEDALEQASWLTLDTNKILCVGEKPEKETRPTPGNVIWFFDEDFIIKDISKIIKIRVMLRYLIEQKIETVVVDPRGDGRDEYYNSLLKEVISRSKFYTKVFVKKGTTIYHLNPSVSYDEKSSPLEVKPLQLISPVVIEPDNVPGEETAGIKSILTDITEELFSKKTLLGRLQIFTQPQLFGLTFYIFIIGAAYWIGYVKVKRPMDWMMLAALVLFALPVLYKFYLNRRYILTILPMAAYFGGIFAGDIYMMLKARRKVKYVWIIATVAGIAIAASFAIPGSSVSARLFAGDGISAYIFSGKLKQSDFLYPGLYEAIMFINDNTPDTAVVLTSNDAQFFSLSKRRGVYWRKIDAYPAVNKVKEQLRDPNKMGFYEDSLTGQKFTLGKTGNALFMDLYRLDISYFLIEPVEGLKRYPETYRLYAPLLSDPRFASLVHDGETKVWKINRNTKPVFKQ